MTASGGRAAMRFQLRRLALNAASVLSCPARAFHGDASAHSKLISHGNGFVAGAARSASANFIHPMAIVHPDSMISELDLEPSWEGVAFYGQIAMFVGKQKWVKNASFILVQEGDKCELCIGDGNDIREYASIHRSSNASDKTIIGNRNLIMGSCHIAHDCKLGNHNILANGALIGGHVIIQNYVHMGGGSAVHQKCHIDSYSFIAGNAMVVHDVPMYAMVAGDRAELRGLNLEGLRRHGFSSEEVRSIRLAYRKLFMRTDSDAGRIEERLDLLEADDEMMSVPAVALFVDSVRSCLGDDRRGICRFRNWVLS